jgi:UDP-N-acetylglucosamine:LPS N-acetylglucosamine transferase
MQEAIAFAGGGSGGHISPGLAIAERIAELEPSRRAVFLCSNRPIDASMLREAGADFIPMPARPPSLHPWRAWRFLRNFTASRRQAMQAMRQRGVDRVVALGGFVAAPVVVAARSLGLPIMLVNLDAPPGKANRWLARRCTCAISTVDLSGFPRFKTFARAIVGLPVRRIALAPGDAPFCRRELGLDPNLSTLLVTGASLGAGSINQLMLAWLREDASPLRGWQVLHLTGTGGEGGIAEAYHAAGVPAVVLPFLTRMGLAWGAADLCISRAGANSVAEIAANAVPAVFLPYPHHRDQHQVHNARPLVDRGGAILATDEQDARRTLAAVRPILEELLRDDARRSAMRDRLRSGGSRDAAMTIARLVLGRPVD